MLSNSALLPDTGRRIRLAHLQLLPLITGVQTVTLEELSRIDRSRFEPVIICQGPGPLTVAAEMAGIKCFFIPDLVREISPLRDLRALRALYVLFKKERFDIVHTHSSKTGVVGRIAGKLAGISVVMHTVHGFAYPSAKSAVGRWLYHSIEWVGARFCDSMIVLKDADRQLCHVGLGVPERKVRLIPNGVDIEKYRPADATTKSELRSQLLSLDDDVVAVGMVGRLWRQKNPECLLEAIPEVVANSTKRVHFYFIGDGELRPVLEARIKELGIESSVTLLGWRNDVPLLLKLFDVFVLPSRWEGLSLALLEALACGLPVLASNIPGNADAVSDGIDGFLFDDDDPESLASKLLGLVQSESLRVSFGKSGRSKVESLYRLDVRIKTMENLYLSLLFPRRDSFRDFAS